MRIIITTLFIFLATFSYSQKVGTTPLSEIDIEFVQIVGVKQGLKNKYAIHLDFGQENKLWNDKDTPIYDENGKQIKFNSMMDALNFMTKYGYEYVDFQIVPSGNVWVHYYLIRKK